MDLSEIYQKVDGMKTNFIIKDHPGVNEGTLGMSCPKCGCTEVHLMGAHVSIRGGEDGEFTEVRATSSGIHVYPPHNYLDKEPYENGPVGDYVGEGRRDRVSLLGHCEAGCEFAIVFTQHKGTTIVEAVFPEITIHRQVEWG